MTQQFVGQRFSVEPDSIWADMITFLTDIVGERNDWYVGVDLQGRNFLSCDGLDTVWYPQDVFGKEEVK
jgi:hypothetical protein